MGLKNARMIVAPVDDPDRQAALKVVNYLAGRPVREVAAVYALAVQMSLRGLGWPDYRNAIFAIFTACISGWRPGGDQAAAWCATCHGAGTVYRGELAVGVDPALQGQCEACGGTGHAKG